MAHTGKSFLLFGRGRVLAKGTPDQVISAISALPSAERERVCVICEETGAVEEVDALTNGTESRTGLDLSIFREVKRTRGRPKMGVITREISICPKQWDWLSRQPGGPSVVVRQLVDAARRDDMEAIERQGTLSAALKFLEIVANELPNFDQAREALTRGHFQLLADIVATWPPSVAAQVSRYASRVASRTSAPPRYAN